MSQLCLSSTWTGIFTLILCTFQSPSLARLVEYKFIVSHISGSPDGVLKENIIGINGHFPGPTIHAEVGDTLQVDVTNSLRDGQNITIHWHGIFQRNSPFQDGTAQISQCPLGQGHTQRYTFLLNQTGTYWYHSHVRSQHTEGFWGALVIHNPTEAYPSDGELVITLNDWYHRPALENEAWYLSPASRGEPPYPDSGMINGLGGYPCPFAKKQGRLCTPSGQKRAVFLLKRNATYRIRVINTSAYFTFKFSIEGHTLSTIEVDGVDTARDVPCDAAFISPAQRYSFLINTNNSDITKKRFVILGDLSDQVFKDPTNINQYPEALLQDVTAILQYDLRLEEENPEVRTTTENHSYSYIDTMSPSGLSSSSSPSRSHEVILDERLLTPTGATTPPYFDKEFTLQVDFYHDNLRNIRRASFNKTSFQLPQQSSPPLLISFLGGQDLNPSGMLTLHVDHGDVVQLIINNPKFNGHPLHLHGNTFHVLGKGGWRDGNFDPQRHSANLSLHGVKRDTVFVEEKSWAVLRFVANNVGLWPFHCHVDWHYLSGMSVMFVVGKEKFRAEAEVPEEVVRVCGHHGVKVKVNLTMTNGVEHSKVLKIKDEFGFVCYLTLKLLPFVLGLAVFRAHSVRTKTTLLIAVMAFLVTLISFICVFMDS